MATKMPLGIPIKINRKCKKKDRYGVDKILRIRLVSTQVGCCYESN
jgi:hypothetical protein